MDLKMKNSYFSLNLNYEKWIFTTPHQSAWAKLLNFLFTSFSITYTANEANISPKNPMYNVVINSCRQKKKKEKSVIVVWFLLMLRVSGCVWVIWMKNLLNFLGDSLVGSYESSSSLPIWHWLPTVVFFHVFSSPTIKCFRNQM